jgi:hypothetical protein
MLEPYAKKAGAFAEAEEIVLVRLTLRRTIPFDFCVLKDTTPLGAGAAMTTWFRA